MPDSIDKGVEVLNLHGSNPIHINLNISQKLYKVLVGSTSPTVETTEEPVEESSSNEEREIDTSEQEESSEEESLESEEPETESDFEP